MVTVIPTKGSLARLLQRFLFPTIEAHSWPRPAINQNNYTRWRSTRSLFREGAVVV